MGWDFSRIEPYVSQNTKLQLMAMVVDNVTGTTDRLSWGETKDGNFTVRSAYAFLTRDVSPRPWLGKLFDRVWKVQAPERVRVFLWQVVHQIIMTNVERYRRHISASALCQVCNGGEETIIHVLRDCPFMSGIWNRIVSPRRR